MWTYVRCVHANRRKGELRAIAAGWARRIYIHRMSAPPENADDVRRIVKEAGVEFLFAQFVDMHAKPNAKLVPATHLHDLLEGGAGFAGFAAGDIGQRP